MIVIIDNYDSFTYNLYQYFARLSAEEVKVIRNDQIDIKALDSLHPSRLIVSPGPDARRTRGSAWRRFVILRARSPF